MDNVLKDVGLEISDNKISALFKKVKKNLIEAKIKTRKPGEIYQADLLFLPDDEGFKYLLVVVDTNNNTVDAEPLKQKTAVAIITGLTNIFKRKYLKQPGFSIEADSGGEFDNKKLRELLNKKNIILRIGESGRSNQQALAEYYNGVIAAILFKKMTVDEIETGEENKIWVEEIPELIKSLNKHMIKDKADIINDNVLYKSKENIIPIGTKVRTALDKPINIVDGKRIYGKLRATDHKWSLKPAEIEDLSIRPNQPIMYKIEGKNHNYFTKNQLQVFNEKEKIPKARVYIIEKLLDKFDGKKGLKYFKVKWQGYDDEKDYTEEPRSKLMKTNKEMVLEYERNERKKK